MEYWIAIGAFGTFFFGIHWLRVTFKLDEAIHRLNCIQCLEAHINRKIELGHWGAEDLV